MKAFRPVINDGILQRLPIYRFSFRCSKMACHYSAEGVVTVFEQNNTDQVAKDKLICNLCGSDLWFITGSGIRIR